MRKLFTLAAAVLASFSLWAVDYYTPTAEEVVEVAVTGPAIATHAAIGNASGTYTAESGKTCCDPSDVSKTKSQFALDLKDGNSKKTLVLNIAGCDSICLYCDRNDRGIKAVFTPSEGEPETIYGQIGLRYTGFKLDPNKSYSITFTGVGSDKSGQDVRVAAVRLIPGETCTDPEFTVSPTEGTGFVGDPIDIAVTSKNQSKPINPAVTVDGVPGVYGTDYTFSVSTGLVQATPLKAGTFVVTFSQASNGTYCDAEESATFVISEKIPVSAVTIDGPAEGIIGAELVYTATAAGATAYEWYLDDVKQGSDSAKFIYTAVKGNHSIVCKARNEFNATEEWIASDAKAVTVTKLCGELIKATRNGKNIDPVTGVVGGTAAKSTQDNGKLGSNGHYWKLTLASGNFMVGDTVIVNVSTAAQQGVIALTSDQEATDLLGASADYGVVGDNKVVLTKGGVNTLWLVRVDASNKWNGVIDAISVVRPCEASSNKEIAELRVNGELVTPEGTTYNYTFSSSYEEATFQVTYVLAHPLAYADFGKTSPLILNTPAPGESVDETLKIIAEDESFQWYSIHITKSTGLSANADLSALSVAGLTLDPVFDANVTEYTVTKAYEAAMPVVGDVTATPADLNAKGAEVTIVGNVITIVVTAENDDTKTYTITVNNAEALKSLSQVKFANGFDAFIDNANHTVKAFYLAGEAAPEATTITAGNGTAGPLSEGKIVVTGADDSQVEYAVTLEAVTPNTDVVEETAAAGAFDGTESWVKGGLHISNPTAGFSDGKYVLRRQLKSGDAADDQRVIAGWVRVYFFVGNASKFELANTTKNNKVKYAIDGGAYTEVEGALSIALEEDNHMIEIVTNQSSGDCNLSAPKLVKRTATAIDNTEAGVKAVKVVRDGQLLIIKGEKTYNIIGVQLR